VFLRTMALASSAVSSGVPGLLKRVSFEWVLLEGSEGLDPSDPAQSLPFIARGASGGGVTVNP
jgi:hypothetical protein